MRRQCVAGWPSSRYCRSATTHANISRESKCELMARGQLIGPMDLLIAAHALSLGATLVTNNEREFKRVKGLKLENWVG